MPGAAQHLLELLAHFLVGNTHVHIARRGIVDRIREIAQVDHEREHVVFAGKGPQVVLKARDVHLYLGSCNKPRDVVLQSFEIHIDVSEERVCGGSLAPVRAESAVVEGLHDGKGAVEGMDFSTGVAIVPALHLRKAHARPLAEPSHLLFQKAHVGRVGPRSQDRVFPEVRECRLRAVLLDGQYAGHEDRREYLCRRPAVLEESP